MPPRSAKRDCTCQLLYFPLTPHRNGFAATVQASVNITNCAETGVGSGCIGGKYACDQSHDRYRAHIHVSTKPVWGPVIELVDLRYRPEVNTIEALAESDPRKHAPLAEPIWTTSPEEYGLGVGGKSKDLNP